jgi:hypothetical protein
LSWPKACLVSARQGMVVGVLQQALTQSTRTATTWKGDSTNFLKESCGLAHASAGSYSHTEQQASKLTLGSAHPAAYLLHRHPPNPHPTHPCVLLLCLALTCTHPPHHCALLSCLAMTCTHPPHHCALLSRLAMTCTHPPTHTPVRCCRALP